MDGAGVDHADESNPEPGRGGRLFWAGDLDDTGQVLVVAANVAGAATLVATGDGDTQRRALHAGIVDFLVNSLDEALRILKNEIRKRAAVAVCVNLPFESVEQEMEERGVLADLFREEVIRTTNQQETGREPAGDLGGDPMSAPALVIWKVDSAPAVWLPKLDAIALDCLELEDAVARRWIRQAGRYLGRLGHVEHLVRSNREFGARLFEQVQKQTERNAIQVRGQIEVTFQGTMDLLCFGPASSKG
jgi:hypothetical protein